MRPASLCTSSLRCARDLWPLTAAHPCRSERLIVSIAASVPNLRHLSLDRVTRSALHAPDLVGARPFVPVVKGDDDIPDHPILGRELRLPSLLCLPALKSLCIRATHLADPNWATIPVACSLEILDLGSCYHESNDYNRMCTERIMGTIGHTVDECALNTALTPQTFAHAKPDTPRPLKKLRKLHLTPLFPVENVVDTLATLSESPVERLSVQCHKDDVVDMCSALESFLNLRVQRGQTGFYQHLNEITVSTVNDLADALERAKQNAGKLFSGITFYVTPKVPVDSKLLKNVVAANGGQVRSHSSLSYEHVC